MPCENVVARLLLKSGKAKVRRRIPFTIQLTGDSTEYTQDITLAVDPGSGTMAVAAASENGDILYRSDLRVRNDIKVKSDQRRKYRRNRRQRKTRYRKPRFLNRTNSRREGRLTITLVSKIHSHVKEIEYVRSILPVKHLIIEKAKFDPALLANPSLADPKIRPWGYQQGPQYAYQNLRTYVAMRDKGVCQCCKGTQNDHRMEAHHIVWRSKGGPDTAWNMVLLCHTCHSGIHDGTITKKFRPKRPTLKKVTRSETEKKRQTTEERWKAKRKKEGQSFSKVPAEAEISTVSVSAEKTHADKKTPTIPQALPIADQEEVAKLMALKHATHTNIICSELMKKYPEAIETYGYITKANRLDLNLEKDHYVDCCVMATGGKPFRVRCDLFHKKAVPEGEFSQRKGQHSEIVLPTGKVEGFLRFDKVRYFGKEYFIKGRMSSGFALLMDINGDTVKFDDMPRGFKTPKFSNLQRVSARSSCLVIRDTAMPVVFSSTSLLMSGRSRSKVKARS